MQSWEYFQKMQYDFPLDKYALSSTIFHTIEFKKKITILTERKN